MENNDTKYDTNNEEKLIIDRQFPKIDIEYIRDQCKKYNINFELLDEEN